MRKMKDSGIEWIGDIPSDWDVCKILYCLKMPLTDGPHTTPELYDDGVPFVSAEAVSCGNGRIDFEHIRGFISEEFYQECCKKYVPHIDDIYMIKSGATTGKVAIVDTERKFTIWSPLAVFRTDIQKVLPKYMFYFLQSNGFQKQVELGWSFGTQQNIGMRALERLNIAFPPLDEQKKIADFLDEKCGEIDSIRSDIQKQIDILNDYKKSVITEAVTKGLDPKAKLKDSGIEWIGKIPEHWEIQKGKYVLKYLQKATREDDGVITCFRDGEVTLRSNRREDGFTISEKEIGYQGIDVGDLVVHGMDGFAGSIGISDSRGKASPVLNVLDSSQNKRYLMYYLRSMAYNNVFVALATGIRVRSCDLRWNKLAELPYPLPPITEQNQIADYIENTLKQTDEILTEKQKQLETLEEYKKSLIFEYVTGKKEVPA